MSQIEQEKYICKICDYKTCKKNNLSRHINSIKHKNNEMLKRAAIISHINLTVW